MTIRYYDTFGREVKSCVNTFRVFNETVLDKDIKSIMNTKGRRVIVDSKSTNWLQYLLGNTTKKKALEVLRETDTTERSYFSDGTILTKTTNQSLYF